MVDRKNLAWLRSEKKLLVEKIEKDQKKILSIQANLDKLNKQFDAVNTLIVAYSASDAERHDTSVSEILKGRPAPFTTMLVQILQKNSRPLRMQDFQKGLEDLGQSKKRNNIYMTLDRLVHKDVITRKDGLYRLAEKFNGNGH